MNNDVFISYSHQDKAWLERLQRMLRPLLRNHPVGVWDDTKIRAGAEWKKEIEKALDSATVAVLLVSDNFLASDFIGDREVPQLLEAAKSRGLRILWVLISDCLWNETEIANYQAVQMPPVPLDSLGESAAKTALKAVCEEIKRALMPELETVTGPPIPNLTASPTPVLPLPLSPPLSPPVARFAGTWRSIDGSWSVVQQNGNAIFAEMYMNIYGVPTKVAAGQGTVVGGQAFFDFLDMYGGGGRSEIALSPDGQSFTGVARYSNGLATSIFSTRS